ncbi:MAG TPA: flagellin [Planctomycetes bacterium]|nr:flagellin [Planctomycetota bacterium]
MTRINTNVSSLNAQKTLTRSNTALQQALTRLSTGLRINTGKDDPAGLIASETLRADIVSVQKAISNSQRASEMIATADSALGQVNALLNDIRALITEAANQGALSDEQIAANQLQIDASLEAINRIAQTTTFQGRKLLDGGLDFVISSTDADFDKVVDLQVYQATLDSDGVDITINVTTAATQASTTVSDAGADNNLDADIVFELAGSKGREVFNFSAGTAYSDIADAINLVSDATGVTASYAAGTLTLTSTDYGSNALVSIEIIGSYSGAEFDDARDTGSDIEASVNGISAQGDGNTLSVKTAALDLKVVLDDSTIADGDSIDFTISSGGALFQLGPEVVSNQQARIGLMSVNVANLRGESGRLYELGSGESADLSTDPTTAAEIVDQVIAKVASLRGRLGAFQRATLDTNIASLTDTLENITAAESAIRDADFAAETAALTRAQILVQSGTAVLAIANTRPQNVLALLGG